MNIDDIPADKVYSPDKTKVKKLFENLVYYPKSKNYLEKLVNKNYLMFTDRGNSSIWISLKLCKYKGIENILIPDQGGWFKYKEFPKKLGMNVNLINTDYGLIDTSDLKNKIRKNSALIVNSLPAYAFEEKNINEIEKICNKKDFLMINDGSGSIGTSLCKQGDIVLGSFGKWKPINLKYGGFIATDKKEYFNYFAKNFDNKIKPFYQVLFMKLKKLDKRRKKFHEIQNQIKKELNDFDIIHKDKKGINVIVRFNNEQERDKIIGYCKKNNYQFTVCPWYIRVMDDAISIEIKRIK